MNQDSQKTDLSRRGLFQSVGKAALAPVVLPPLVKSAVAGFGETEAEATDIPVAGSAGVDRITVLGSKTYLRGWAGYGEPPVMGRPQNQPAQVNYAGQAGQASSAPAPAGPAPSSVWSKESGPGSVTFADPKALITSATISALGSYVLKLTVTNGESTHTSTLHVSVEPPPPARQLEAVYTKNFKISSPFWKDRAKTLIVNWIPHCIDEMNREDLPIEQSGIDNFINAGKALRGEPHRYHKGYVFSNA